MGAWPLIAAAALARAAAGVPPNIVFIHDESTDGRLYLPSSKAIPIPNIRGLQRRGVNFENHYVNVPICAPSRSSMWCGRQPHNIPHMHNGFQVGGAWNNYEGVGKGNSTINATFPGVNEESLIGGALTKAGYTVRITGKTDWVAGGHSLLTMVDSWSIYARFPYSQPRQGGFHVWGDCGGNLTVQNGTGPHDSAHANDWKVVDANVAWLGGDAPAQQPFFLFAGLNIVHPIYLTTQKYLDRIDIDAIEAPHWRPLEELHPCDLQTVLKKGCALPVAYQNTTRQKQEVIAGYYAMITEYDEMVGATVDAVESAGLTGRTVFMLSSDHGDMHMEHQQFYKMVAYEASSHVPLVIAAGEGVAGLGFRGAVSHLTQMVDIFPTLLDIAGAAPADAPPGLDGQSLVPFLKTGASAGQRPNIISQFHGEDLAMSWYMIREGDIKAVFWGTGKEHPAQMFNLSADPDEHFNIAADDPALLADLEQKLRAQVDYPAVSIEVARYNIEQARYWVQTTPLWECLVNGTCHDPDHGKARQSLQAGGTEYWAQLWQLGPAGYWKAWYEWINGPAEVVPCPATFEHNWPPA